MRIRVDRWSDLPRMARAIRQAEDAIRHEGSATLKSLVQEEAPVLTGELRDSVTVEHQGDKTDLVTVLAAHGVFVQFGTRYQAANPFWSRALMRFEPIFADRSRWYFRRAIHGA